MLWRKTTSAYDQCVWLPTVTSDVVLQSTLPKIEDITGITQFFDPSTYRDRAVSVKPITGRLPPSEEFTQENIDNMFDNCKKKQYTFPPLEGRLGPGNNNMDKEKFNSLFNIKDDKHSGSEPAEKQHEQAMQTETTLTAQAAPTEQAAESSEKEHAHPAAEATPAATATAAAAAVQEDPKPEAATGAEQPQTHEVAAEHTYKPAAAPDTHQELEHLDGQALQAKAAPTEQAAEPSEKPPGEMHIEYPNTSNTPADTALTQADASAASTLDQAKQTEHAHPAAEATPAATATAATAAVQEDPKPEAATGAEQPQTHEVTAEHTYKPAAAPDTHQELEHLDGQALQAKAAPTEQAAEPSEKPPGEMHIEYPNTSNTPADTALTQADASAASPSLDQAKQNEHAHPAAEATRAATATAATASVQEDQKPEAATDAEQPQTHEATPEHTYKPAAAPDTHQELEHLDGQALQAKAAPTEQAAEPSEKPPGEMHIEYPNTSNTPADTALTQAKKSAASPSLDQAKQTEHAHPAAEATPAATATAATASVQEDAKPEAASGAEQPQTHEVTAEHTYKPAAAPDTHQELEHLDGQALQAKAAPTEQAAEPSEKPPGEMHIEYPNTSNTPADTALTQANTSTASTSLDQAKQTEHAHPAAEATPAATATAAAAAVQEDPKPEAATGAEQPQTHEVTAEHTYKPAAAPDTHQELEHLDGQALQAKAAPTEQAAEPSEKPPGEMHIEYPNTSNTPADTALTQAKKSAASPSLDQAKQTEHAHPAAEATPAATAKLVSWITPLECRSTDDNLLARFNKVVSNQDKQEEVQLSSSESENENNQNGQTEAEAEQCSPTSINTLQATDPPSLDSPTTPTPCYWQPAQPAQPAQPPKPSQGTSALSQYQPPKPSQRQPAKPSQRPGLLPSSKHQPTIPSLAPEQKANSEEPQPAAQAKQHAKQYGSDAGHEQPSVEKHFLLRLGPEMVKSVVDDNHRRTKNLICNWKHKLPEYTKICINENGQQGKIVATAVLKQIVTIENFADLRGIRDFQGASEEHKRAWRKRLVQDKKKLYRWALQDICALPQPLQAQQVKGRAMWVDLGTLKPYLEPTLPQPDLRETCAHFVSMLSESDKAKLARRLESLDGRTITIGSTCSGTDVCVCVMNRTFEALCEQFNATWLNYLYIYIYIMLCFMWYPQSMTST